MLVPSLTLGCLGTYAYIGFFIGTRFGDSFSNKTGQVCLIGAAGASLALGALATRFFIGRQSGGVRSPVAWIIVLIVSGILFLLFLDAYALWHV